MWHSSSMLLQEKDLLLMLFFDLGICISYSRLLQLTSELGNGVCERFELDGVFCPPKMRGGLFAVHGSS